MKHLKIIFYLLILSIPIYLFSCGQGQSDEKTDKDNDSTKITVQHPDWVKNAVIYEVNLRQYSKEGTFKEFEKHLPRLKELGVNILWFMPVNPIGIKNRKGTLGSNYSVKDYTAISPEFGTFDEFKSMVKTAHDMGFYVIIDWVANHTAWDHEWTKKHPEFYTKDSVGNLVPPIGTDWSDVIDLNYENKELRKEMTSALKFWIDSANIDGFRCDVASWVPQDFWNQAFAELNKIKPLFRLAEAEDPKMHIKAFDASYGWEMHHTMSEIAKGKRNVSKLDSLIIAQNKTYNSDAIHMYFITNHDENTWNGTVTEKFGDGAKAFAVLTFTLAGMPLIYSGQEAGLERRLKFFEKDPINWEQDKELPKFYKSLCLLKKNNSALWNGNAGAPLKRLKTNNDTLSFAFVRESSDNKVLAVFNLSGKPLKIKIDGAQEYSGIKSYFSDQKFENKEMELKPWEYQVYVK